MPSHGSLTKTGKVRRDTPHIPKTVFRKTTPLRDNRMKYLKSKKQLSKKK